MVDGCLSSLFKLGALKIKGEVPEKNEMEGSKLDVSLLKPENKPKRMIRIGNSAELSVSRLGRASMKGTYSISSS